MRFRNVGRGRRVERRRTFGRLGSGWPIRTAAASASAPATLLLLLPLLLLLLLLLVRLGCADFENIRARRRCRLIIRWRRLVFYGRGLTCGLFHIGLGLTRHSFGTFGPSPFAPLFRVSRRNGCVDDFLPIEVDAGILRLERASQRIVEWLPADLDVGWRTKPVEDARADLASTVCRRVHEVEVLVAAFVACEAEKSHTTISSQLSASALGYFFFFFTIFLTARAGFGAGFGFFGAAAGRGATALTGVFAGGFVRTTGGASLLRWTSVKRG